MSRKNLMLLIVGDALEGLALRAYMEAQGVQVDTRFCGNPADFLRFLREPMPADTTAVVISAHGGEEGIFFGEYGEGVHTALLRNGRLPPDNLRDLASFKGASVVLTGCLTGTHAFAQAFLRHGAELFLAPQDYPEASDVMLFMVRFLHARMIAGRPAAESAELAGNDPLLPPGLFMVAQARENAPAEWLPA